MCCSHRTVPAPPPGPDLDHTPDDAALWDHPDDELAGSRESSWGLPLIERPKARIWMNQISRYLRYLALSGPPRSPLDIYLDSSGVQLPDICEHFQGV